MKRMPLLRLWKNNNLYNRNEPASKERVAFPAQTRPNLPETITLSFIWVMAGPVGGE
jgi:hypothetical protein